MINTVKAIYKEGRLIFLDETVVPEDGTEVTVTFTKNSKDKMSGLDAINALYGSGKGENLLEELLESRREDLEHEERNYRRSRS